jgi:FMN-dependent NADH-azoreductase
MKRILSITTSSRGEASNSTQLAKAIIAKLTDRYPGSTVKERDLAVQKFPHLVQSNVAAFFAPAPEDTASYREAIRNSEEGIKEVEEADIIVIGVAIYNWSIPSALKAWIDHVVRVNKTFSYQNGQPDGAFKNKKLYLAIASGGVYSEGPMKDYDFATPYLKFVLGVVGFTDITIFRAEGVNLPDLQETALQKGIESVLV